MVCQVVVIPLHYLVLAHFVWMSLLSLNVARHFYHAMKFIVNEERESWHYLILYVYMAAGWLSPLLVLIVTVPVNYYHPRSSGLWCGWTVLDESDIGNSCELHCFYRYLHSVHYRGFCVCVHHLDEATLVKYKKRHEPQDLVKWHSSNVEIDKTM